jgi:UPF0716 protein FxsA
MPLLALLVAFVVVPIAELYVIVELMADAIGPVPTIALLVLDSVLGAALLRWQGRTTWQRFIEAVQAGRVPHREILDGVLVIFGGALLITPGFLTDLVGLGLLLPPTRAVVRRFLARLLSRRAVTGFADAAFTARERRRPPADDVVEGTAWEADGHGASAQGDREAQPGGQAAPRLER